MANTKKKPAAVVGKGTKLETPPRRTGSGVSSSSSSRAGGGEGGEGQPSTSTLELQPSPAETVSTCSSSGAEEEEEVGGVHGTQKEQSCRHRSRSKGSARAGTTKKMGQRITSGTRDNGMRDDACSESGSRGGGRSVGSGGSGSGECLPPLFPRTSPVNDSLDSTASILAGSVGDGGGGGDGEGSFSAHAPDTPEGSAAVPRRELFPPCSSSTTATPVRRGKKKKKINISPGSATTADLTTPGSAADGFVGAGTGSPDTPSRDVGVLLKSSREDLDDMGTQLQLMEDDLARWNEQFDSLLTSYAEDAAADDDTKSGGGGSASMEETSEDILVAAAKEKRRAEEEARRDAAATANANDRARTGSSGAPAIATPSRGNKSLDGAPRAPFLMNDCGSSFDSGGADSASGIGRGTSSTYDGGTTNSVATMESEEEERSRREARRRRNNRNLRRKVKKRDMAIEELKASQAVLLERIVAVRSHSNRSRKNCSKLSRAFQGVIRKLVAKEEERFREMGRKLAKSERDVAKRDRRIEELERQLAETTVGGSGDGALTSSSSSSIAQARGVAGDTGTCRSAPPDGGNKEEKLRVNDASPNGTIEEPDEGGHDAREDEPFHRTGVEAFMSEQRRRRRYSSGEDDGGGCAPTEAEAALHKSYGAFIEDLQATYRAENRELRARLQQQERKEEKSTEYEEEDNAADAPRASSGREVGHSTIMEQSKLPPYHNELFVCEPNDSTKLAKLASEGIASRREREEEIAALHERYGVLVSDLQSSHIAETVQLRKELGEKEAELERVIAAKEALEKTNVIAGQCCSHNVKTVF